MGCGVVQPNVFGMLLEAAWPFAYATICDAYAQGQAASFSFLPGTHDHSVMHPLVRAQAFGVLYMDVDAATALRGDGHIQKEDKSWDCLHYCIPGPIDHWVNLLFNMFLVFNQTLQQVKGGGGG